MLTTQQLTETAAFQAYEIMKLRGIVESLDGNIRRLAEQNVELRKQVDEYEARLRQPVDRPGEGLPSNQQNEAKRV